MSGSILILGKDGMVGSALVSRLGKRALAAGRQDVDLSAADFIAQLETWLAGRNLSAVINAAAYTKVDKAEDEGRLEAMRVNGEAVAELALWCKKRALPLVHYSTDYVFDGSGDKPRRESDVTSPVNTYGKSKWAGEQAIQKVGGHYLILRTSWVYDARGKNFFNTMLRLFGEKDTLNVVNDQMGAPTYAPQLVQASIEALEHALAMDKFPAGLYHLCNAGATSWHGFAEAIFALARTQDSGIKCQRINAILTAEYPLPAKRPLNSRLDCTLAGKTLGVALPHWDIGLKECIQEKYAGSGLQAHRS